MHSQNKRGRREVFFFFSPKQIVPRRVNKNNKLGKYPRSIKECSTKLSEIWFNVSELGRAIATTSNANPFGLHNKSKTQPSHPFLGVTASPVATPTFHYLFFHLPGSWRPQKKKIGVSWLGRTAFKSDLLMEQQIKQINFPWTMLCRVWISSRFMKNVSNVPRQGFSFLTHRPSNCNWPHNYGSITPNANKPRRCIVLGNDDGEQGCTFTVHLRSFSTLLHIKPLKPLPAPHPSYLWL